MTFETHIFNEAKIILPLLPEDQSGVVDEATIYSRFVRHLQMVPNSQPAIKVLSAIQFTADFLGYSDAHVSKVLVDLGLRATRQAFPAEFLNYVDAALPRGGWEIGGPSQSVQELASYWIAVGEDPFIAAKLGYPVLDVGVVV